MKVHLIAIGGTGMGAVAGLLSAAGHEVRGSDLPLYPPMSAMLEQLGIPLFTGYQASNLDWGPELVVLGNTCTKTHVEYLAAQRRGLPVVSFPELLSRHFLAERQPIVVAGTHGKTTTSSLVAHILRDAGLEAGFLVGGVPANFGKGFELGRPPYFVIEGDEYDSACFDKRPKFAHYRPRYAILTGIEFDHADIYDDIEAVERAFLLLVEAMPPAGRLFVSAESSRAMRSSQRAPCAVESYRAVTANAPPEAETTEATWVGRYTGLGAGRQQLRVWHRGQPVGDLEVPLLGHHNMGNTLAAVAVARSLDVPVDRIARALDRFAGVARRQQVRGVVEGVAVIDDFAHHPTAIRETLRALRGVHGAGRLIAVFEPRSSTSRRNVFRDELPRALLQADCVFVAPLYQPEKIPADQRLDLDGVLRDVRAGGTEAYALEVDRIVDELAHRCAPGDTVVVMSSGGFDGLIDKLLAALHRKAATKRSPNT